MKTITMIRNLTGLGALAFAMGCVAPAEEATSADQAAVAEEGPVAEVSSAISGGSPAVTWMQQRTVVVRTPTNPGGACTGTIISNTHVLTASHCKVTEDGNSSVSFYNNSNTPSAGSTTVTQVQLVPGVFPLADDTTDNNGDFADIAVLTLASAIPSTSVVAGLEIIYPGSSASNTQIGRGGHDGNPNPTNLLKFVQNNYYSSNNSGGYFYTNNDSTDGGDSGGPIFTNTSLQLQGALWGNWLVAGAMRDKYTAVSFHLPFILNAIGYTGSFTSITPNFIRNGTAIRSIVTSDLNTCKLDCMQHSTCMAFDFRPAPLNICTIHSTLGSLLSSPGATTGTR